MTVCWLRLSNRKIRKERRKRDAAKRIPLYRIELVELFAEDEDFLLTGEANFGDLTGVVQQHRVIVRLRVAIFPASLALGDDSLALLHGGLVAVDHQAILSRVQLRRSDLGGLVDIDRFADRLCENRHGQRDHREQNHTPKN